MNEVEFEYFYGGQSEQYTFYRVPKLMFTESIFQNLSAEARLLYGLLLDRMSLSRKNGWLDEQNRAYIVFTVADVMETLGCAEHKAVKLLSELDTGKGIGLIERKRQGLGKPNIIYIRNFAERSQIHHRENHNSGIVETAIQELQKSQLLNCDNDNSRIAEMTIQELQKSQFKSCGESNSRVAENANQELRKSQCSNTDSNNTEYNDTEYINLSICTSDVDSGQMRLMDGMEERESLRETIHENIEYPILLERLDRDRVDELVELTVDMLCTKKNTVTIGGEDMDARIVKDRMLELNGDHIEYVIRSMDETCTDVHNIRNYLLTALYRAPLTMASYWRSRVNHDEKKEE